MPPWLPVKGRLLALVKPGAMMMVKAIAAGITIVAMAGGATLRDSHVSFKQALAACSGALGSVSFSLGHARIAASAGVDTDESPGSSGQLSVVLQDGAGSKSAKVTIDQRQRMVMAKNVRVAGNNAIACILPD